MRNIYFLLYFLYISWVFIGIFPLTCYESDSMHLIAGCDMMNQDGWQFPPNYSYQYDMQPLITYFIVGLVKVIPIITCEEAYCILTAIAALLLSTLTIEIVYRLTHINRIWILLGLFLLPESAAIAMYPNSAVFASLFFIGGIWLLLNNYSSYYTVLLLGIAPLCRIDILIIYPVIAFILWWKGFSLKRCFTQSLLLAIGTIIIICLGCFFLKANPLRSFFSYNSFNETLAYSSLVIYAIIAFYTVLGIILVPWGMTLLSKKKEFKLIAVAIIPMILLHIMFRNTGCAAKHYLYLIPFVLILTSSALYHIYNKYTLPVKFSITLCLFLFLTLSVRVILPQYEWIERPGAAGKAGPLLTLYQESTTPYKISVGIGTGQLIPTADEYMLASGNLFYPIYIHKFKQNLIKYKTNVETFLKSKDEYDLLVFSWQDEYHYHTQLIKQGFQIYRNNKHENQIKTLYYKKDQKVTLYFEQISEKDTKLLNESISNHAINNRETYIITTRCDRTTSGMEALISQGYIEQVNERIYKIKPIIE